MSVLNSFVSGTQTIGNIANYWHIFVMILVLAFLMFIFYSSAMETDWPPECIDGNPPSGEKSCAISKIKFLGILAVIILILILVIYLSWTFKDNKYFQTAEGLGVEGNFLSRLF